MYKYLKNHTKLVRKRCLHRIKIAYKALRNTEEKSPFFILTTPRTGSNMLLDYLNSVPGVSFAPEILNRDMAYGIRAHAISKYAALRHIRHSVLASKYTVCGAKLHGFQMERCGIVPEDLLRMFPNARFIILYRRSLIEQYVSLKTAQLTDQWHSSDRVVPQLPAIHVDVEDFKKFCWETRAFYGDLLHRSWLKKRAVVLSYEELVRDADTIFSEALFPFLGASPVGITCKTRKQNTLPLRDRILNFQDINLILRFEGMWQEYTPTPTPVAPERVALR